MERELEDSTSALNILKGNNVFKKEDFKKKENDQILDDFLPKEWIGFYSHFYIFFYYKIISR